MKRSIAGVAFGALLALGSMFHGSTAAQAAPSEAQGIVLRGCVITSSDDEVVFRVHGTGVGGGGRILHIKTTAIPDYDPSTTADACGAIVVYQEDDVWYAESISVTRDEDGEVTVEQHSGSRPVRPRDR